LFGFAPIKLSELAAFKTLNSFRGLNSMSELLLENSFGGLAGSSGFFSVGAAEVYLLNRGRKRELFFGGADLGKSGGATSFLTSLLKRPSFNFRLMKEELGLSITLGFDRGEEDSLGFAEVEVVDGVVAGTLFTCGT